MFGIILIISFLIYYELKVWQKSKIERLLNKAKDDEIKRLIEDNVWMRKILMKKVMKMSNKNISEFFGP